MMSSPNSSDRQIVRLNYIEEGDLKTRLQGVVDALRVFHQDINVFDLVYPEFKRNRLLCITRLEQINARLMGFPVPSVAEWHDTTVVLPCLGIVPAADATIAGIVVAAGAGLLYNERTRAYYSQNIIKESDVNELTSLLSRDKSYGEKLRKWIVCIDNIIRAIEKIADYDIFEEISKAFEADKERCQLSEKKHSSEKLPESLELCIKNLHLSDQQYKDVRGLFSYIMKDIDCLHIFITVFTLFVPLIPIIKQTDKILENAAHLHPFLVAPFNLKTIPKTPTCTKPAIKFLIVMGGLLSGDVPFSMSDLPLHAVGVSYSSIRDISRKIGDFVKRSKAEFYILEIVYQKNPKVTLPPK